VSTLKQIQIQTLTPPLLVDTDLELERGWWLFVTLMERSQTLYTSGLPGFNLCVEIMELLVPRVVPSFHVYLVQLGVPISMWSQTWFLSLFAYETIPLAVSARIWDSFILDGIECFFRVTLAALKMYEHTLVSTPLDRLLPLLQRLCDVTDATALMRCAWALQIDPAIVARMRGIDELVTQYST